MDVAKRMVVYGMVQGVGFRAFTREAGSRLGLTGDVRNLTNGAVEIIAEGSAAAMTAFIKKVEQGPMLSHVEHVSVTDIPATGAWRSFLLEGR